MEVKCGYLLWDNPLFTFYSCLYVFSFLPFSNISKAALGFTHMRSCREFQALPFNNKKRFYHTNNIREILKYAEVGSLWTTGFMN